MNDLDVLTEQIIGCAMKVHSSLGPGLLESAYEACLECELKQSGLAVERQKSLPVIYRDLVIDCGYRIDLMVEQKVIVELKAVGSLAPIHEAQMRSYLKLSGTQVGLLLNFNVLRLRDGIKRVVNNYAERAAARE